MIQMIIKHRTRIEVSFEYVYLCIISILKNLYYDICYIHSFIIN